jgi:hypothetical protein
MRPKVSFAPLAPDPHAIMFLFSENNLLSLLFFFKNFARNLALSIISSFLLVVVR